MKYVPFRKNWEVEKFFCKEVIYQNKSYAVVGYTKCRDESIKIILVDDLYNEIEINSLNAVKLVTFNGKPFGREVEDEAC